MLYGNSIDTSCNITRHESEQTSNWSLIVRKFGESFYEEIANDRY